MKLERAIQKATDTVNLIGQGCDVYEVLYRYKAIRELPETEIDKIYDEIVTAMGF